MNKQQKSKALLRSILSVLLCVAMLAGSIGLPIFATETAEESANLLTNGDFESGITGWTKSAGSNGTVDVETVDANSYLQITSSGGSKSQAWAHVSGLQVGQKIIVSGRYYAEKTLNSVKVFAHATNGTATTNGVFTNISLSTPTSDGWQDFSMEYTLPEGTYNGIRLRFEIMNAGDNNGNAVLFDDLKVCIESPEQEEAGEKLPLLQNGDFEAGAGSWVLYAQSTNSSTTIVEENGNKYLKMYSTGGDLCQTYDHIYGLEPGQTLYITGRYSKTGTTKAEVWAHGTVGSTTENGVYGKLELTEETNGEWAEFSFEYTIPEGKNGIRFRVSIDSTDGATVLFDDLQVYTDATDVALIAKEFREMLAAEAENYPTVNKNFQEGVTDTFPGQPANILINGDFNADSIGTGWTLGTVGSIVADAGADGSNALQISGTGAPVVPQIVEITGGAEYYVTYKYKVNEDQTSANPTVKFEFFASMTLDGGSYVAEKYVGTGGAIKDGQWHTVSGWIRPPANATVMKVMPRMLQSADQTVMFDDITITMTQAPFALSLVTDQIFYYTGAETGTFTTSVNTNYYPDLASAKVDFQVYDKMVEIWSATGIVSSNGVASATFDLTKLTQKEYPYCVKATIYNADGTVADASVQNIYIYDKPEYIDENGLFIKNGDEPFYPVMGYHVGYTDKENNHYAEAAAAGINLIQIYGSSAKDQLDALHEQGLMGVVTLYKNMKPAGADENIDYVTGVLSEEVVNHPALFGYILMDEVYLALSNPEKDMEASYRLIRMMDKKHPIVTMEAMATYYDECAKFVDLLFIDPYSDASDKNAYTATKTALNAVNHKKGVYALLCTYGTELTWDRAEDIRNNNYQALIAGADAVGYYAISDGVVRADNTTTALWNCEFDADPDYTVWDKVVEFGTVERDMAFDHFVYGKTPTFSQNLGEDYWYSSWMEADGSIYMIVLGMKDEQSVTAQIPLVSTDGNTFVGNFVAEIVAGISPSYTGAKNFSGNGTLNVTVEDTSAILYKITATSEPPVSSHKYEAVVTEPTCTEGGYTTYICECGDSYVADYTDPLGHDFTKKLVATTTLASDATCTEAAKYYYSCKRCEALGTETFTNGQPNGHDYEAAIIEPTCTENGYTTYTCHCGDSYVADFVDALGHDFTWKLVATTTLANPATCDKAAEYFYSCRHCEELDKEHTFTIGDPNGHAYEAIEVVDPTCTEDGYTVYSCAECGDSYVADHVEAHGHNVVLMEHQEATCDLNGYEYYACQHCGDEEYTIILEATGHSYEDGVCTECGDKDPNYKKPTIKDWFDKWFGSWFDKPGKPNNPTEPEVPSEPETPTEPSKPEKPSKPVKPGFGGIFDWFFGWWNW